jgi:hypothetical protein
VVQAIRRADTLSKATREAAIQHDSGDTSIRARSTKGTSGRRSTAGMTPKYVKISPFLMTVSNLIALGSMVKSPLKRWNSMLLKTKPKKLCPESPGPMAGAQSTRLPDVTRPY